MALQSSKDKNGIPTSEVIQKKLPPPVIEKYESSPWIFESTKSHIMSSECTAPDMCTSDAEENLLCDFCRYERILGERPLPDMIFSKNKLSIKYRSLGAIQFSALDALKELRESDHDNIQVAHAKEWREARKDCEYTNNIVQGYDWTYTTDYNGTILGDLTIEPSSTRINMDKLRRPETIRFYKELYLYEDELDDNGATNCVIKIRCMDSGFLVLFRHYLRVDHVLIRVLETRLYHETGTNYIIRERVTKAKNIEHLNVGCPVYKCPDQVSQLLDVVKEEVDKIVLPDT